MVSRLIPFFARLVLLIAVAMAIGGCVAGSPTSSALAVTYESPRPWGFGWSVVILCDGLVMVQVDAELIEYCRLAREDTNRLFNEAQSIVARRDAMANVVDAENGWIELRGADWVQHASWDELIMPDYGFTARRNRHKFDEAARFARDWTAFTTDLAGAVSAAHRMDAVSDVDQEHAEALRVAKARWNDLRPWWQELMERAIRARHIPIEDP